MKDEYDFSKGKRGAVLSTEGMTHIHFYIKDEILEELRRQSEQLETGYQTLINSILRKHIESSEDFLDLPLESQPLNKALPVSSEGHRNSRVLADDIHRS